MELRQILEDDNAVSPVIGVILMVAITVILAAVIATFVLGLGDQVSNTAPQASFSFDYDEGTFHDDSPESDEEGSTDVTHDGGDSIEASNLYIRGATSSTENGNWATAGTGSSEFTTSEMISAGNGLTIDVSSDDTIRVVFQAESGGNSATLGRWDGPDA